MKGGGRVEELTGPWATDGVAHLLREGEAIQRQQLPTHVAKATEAHAVAALEADHLLAGERGRGRGMRNLSTQPMFV